MNRTEIIRELKILCDTINKCPEYEGEDKKAKIVDTVLTSVLNSLDDLKNKIDKDSTNKDTFLEDLFKDVEYISQISQH